MNIFDIMGPVMIGPSSSHTAGACRLGRVAYKMLGEEPTKARIVLSGSFALTGKGHGTDKAIVAGCMGLHSYDEKLRHSFDEAKLKGFYFEIEYKDIPNTHPNTAYIEIEGASGKKTTVLGASIGGGNIMINRINGMDAEYNGANNALLIEHYDRKGVIANVTSLVASNDLNICNFKLSREKRGGKAIMLIEIDDTRNVSREMVKEIRENLKKIENVTDVIFLHSINN